MSAAVLVTYFVIVVLIGVYMRRRIHNETDYLAAGGKVGPLVGGATLAATQMSSGVAVGAAAFHYLYGYNFAWVWLCIWAAYVIKTFLLAPKMKKFFISHGGLTIPDLLGTRYHSVAVRLISVVILIIGFSMLMVAELVGGSFVLEAAFGFPKATAVLAISAIFIVYTLLGGLFAIVYTDMLQMVVFVVGFAIAVSYVVPNVGGFAGLNERLAEIDVSLVHNGMPSSALVAVGISFFVLLIGYPVTVIRFYSLKDTRTIRRAVGICFVLQACVAVAIALLGTSARVLLPDLSTPDLAAPMVAMQLLPAILGGLLLAALIAAIQSTVSAMLLMLGSAISHDVVKQTLGKRLPERKQVQLTRLFVLLLGLLPLPFALNPTPLITEIVVNGATVVGSAFSVPIVFGMVWRRATRWGALASMLGGAGVAVASMPFGAPFGLETVYVSVPVSLLLMVVVSVMTPASPRDALSPFFRLAERNSGMAATRVASEVQE